MLHCAGGAPCAPLPLASQKTPSHAGVPEAVGLYVYGDDVDALARRAKALSEPETMFWGDRMARIEDPDGYSWTFATNVADFDASKMPK